MTQWFLLFFHVRHVDYGEHGRAVLAQMVPAWIISYGTKREYETFVRDSSSAVGNFLPSLERVQRDCVDARSLTHGTFPRHRARRDCANILTVKKNSKKRRTKKRINRTGEKYMHQCRRLEVHRGVRALTETDRLRSSTLFLSLQPTRPDERFNEPEVAKVDTCESEDNALPQRATLFHRHLVCVWFFVKFFKQFFFFASFNTVTGFVHITPPCAVARS